MERSNALLAPLPGALSSEALPPARRRRYAPWWRLKVPWTVYRYLAVEVLRIAVLGVLAVSLLYSTLAAYQAVRSGLQLSFIWPLIVKTFAYPLYFSIPISLLFGVTLAIGRMVGDLEITALRCHGMGSWHVFIPVLVLALVLGSISFYVNGWVVPQIHYEKRNLQAYILDQLENLGSGINRTILLPGDEGTLWVGAYSAAELRRVRVDLTASKDSSIIPALRDHLPEKIPTRVRIFALEGKLDILPGRKSVVLNLRRVEILVPEPVKTASIANEIFYQKFAITDNVSIPLSFAPKNPGIKDRTTPELLRHIQKLREDSDPRRAGVALAATQPPRDNADRARAKLPPALTELYRRMAFTLSCLTFPFAGVSLALLLNRWSRLVPFFAGNLAALVLFYPLLMVGSYLGENGFFPMASMMLPNLALLGLGAYLVRKVLQQ